MKTSSIQTRVADFLGRFPPFSYFDPEAVLRLAAGGRVRFYERGETIFSVGEHRDRWLRVIQKGSIQLLRLVEGSTSVADVRGAGDLLGVGALVKSEKYTQTAEALDDTIVYALEMKAFVEECADCPQASRFLAIYFQATDLNDGRFILQDARAGSRERDRLRLPMDPRQGTTDRMVILSAAATLADAARHLAREGQETAFVLAADGSAIGMVKANDLLARVAAGEVSSAASVFTLLISDVVTTSMDASVGENLLLMMRKNCSILVVTSDGTRLGSVTGIISERDLMLRYGNNPLTIVHAIHRTDNPVALRVLRERIDKILFDELGSFDRIDWVAEVISEANHAVIRRIIDCSVTALENETGNVLPGHFCMVLAGSAGRGELLNRADLACALIHEDASPEATAWFQQLGGKIASRLLACGFDPSPHGITPASSEGCASLAEWKARFTFWIEDPIQGRIWTRMPFFDFTAVGGLHPLLADLRVTVQDRIRERPEFIRLLANDALQNMPPLSIVEGYAVAADGLQISELNIKTHATQPVVDVARVFELDCGLPGVTGTLARLADAEKFLPAEAATLNAAARAFRIVLSMRAMRGVEAGNDGSLLVPATLTRADQMLLKSAFRSIADLLKLLASRYDLGS